MDQALKAIASPVRRRMLQLVRDAERPATDIAARCRLTKPAASQHLKVLRDAGLVAVRVDGNRRLYRARPERIDELRTFLENFWTQRLVRLRDAAEAVHRGESRKPAP